MDRALPGSNASVGCVSEVSGQSPCLVPAPWVGAGEVSSALLVPLSGERKSCDSAYCSLQGRR